MATITFIAPIMPGKSEFWRRLLQEMAHSRRAEYEALCRRLGITAERAWLIETLKGDIAIITLEVEQLEPVIAYLASADLPFERWLREQLLALQGLDLTRLSSRARLEPVFEWQK